MNQPCGQTVTPTVYFCSECKMTGSSILWEDAWSATIFRNKVRELEEKLERSNGMRRHLKETIKQLKDSLAELGYF